MADQDDGGAKSANRQRGPRNKPKSERGPKLSQQAQELIRKTWEPMEPDTSMSAREVLRRAMIANAVLGERWAEAAMKMNELRGEARSDAAWFHQVAYMVEVSIRYQERAAAQAVRLIPYEEHKLPPKPPEDGKAHVELVHPADEVARSVAEAMRKIEQHLRGTG